MLRIKRSILLGLCLLIGSTVFGQQPSTIILNPVPGIQQRACPDRDAGTVQLAQFIGESNDVSLRRSYFCFNDRYLLEHNQDGDVSESDPDPFTPAGVGYVWYSALPTISGPDLAAVRSDPSLLVDPTPPTNGMWVYVDEISGNALFQNGSQVNNKSIPDYFNNGDPIEVFFAPITIDALSSGGQAVFEGVPEGPCVNVNTAAAFSIVYLNPVSIRNKDVDKGNGTDCQGTFVVEGGLPEFDGSSSYTINIYLESDPTVTANIVGSNFGHGDLVTFTTSQEGRYVIEVLDDKACPYTGSMDLYCEVLVTITIEDQIIESGATECIDFVVDGFDGIVGFAFDFSWNPELFEYVDLTNFAAGLNSPTINYNFTDQGYIGFTWTSFNPLTLPAGTVLFSLCLTPTANAEPGDRTNIGYQGRINKGIGNSLTSGVLNIISGSATVAYPADLGFNISKCPASGIANSGTIGIIPYGGTGPYSVFMTPLAGGPTQNLNVTAEGLEAIFENLTAGNYNVSVTDVTGAISGPTIVVITNGNRPNISFIARLPRCHDTKDGEIQATISPGGNYEFEWSNGTYQNTITDLENDMYALTITDQNGCKVSDSIRLNTEALVVNTTTVDATCELSTDGEVLVEAFGGTTAGGQYIYSLNNQNPFQGTTYDNLTLEPGDYLIRVSDNNGCIVNEMFTIGFSNRLMIEDAFFDPPLGCTAAQSTINVEVGMEDPDPDDVFSFIWSGAAAPGSNSGNTSTSEMVGEGTYTLTVRNFDHPGCRLDTTFELAVGNPLGLESFAITNAFCDAANGAISVTAQGGEASSQADYIYQWHDNMGNIIGGGSNLSNIPGDSTYYLTILDKNLCPFDTSFYVDIDPLPTINGYDSISVNCSDPMSGRLTVDIDVPAFNVMWTNLATMETTTGKTALNIGAGDYMVAIDLGANCIIRDTVSLGGAANVSISDVNYVNPSCRNSTDGSIEVLIIDPPADVVYTWSGGGTPNGNILNDAGVGTYTLTISAPSTGCPDIVLDTLTLRAPNRFTADLIINQGVTCVGTCNAQATVSMQNTTGTLNYTWSDGSTTAMANNLCAGNQFVIVSDDICTDTFYVDVPAGDSLMVDIDFNHPLCAGDANGAIRVTASGGTGNFTFTWTGTTATGAVAEQLSAGTYMVTVADDNNCATTRTIELIDNPPMTGGILDALSVEPSCAGIRNGAMTASISGGSPPYIYNWDGFTRTDSTIQTLGGGWHYLEVRDINNCAVRDSAFLNEPPGPRFELVPFEPISCFGATTTLEIDTVYGNGGPFSYSINNGPAFPLSETTEVIGDLPLVITIYDAIGCSEDTIITLTQPEEIVVDLGPDQRIDLGDSLRLGAQSIYSVFAVDSLIWTVDQPDATLSCTDCSDPWLQAVRESVVSLEVVDENGCSGYDEMIVSVDKTRRIYIPNAFSPNDDLINDELKIFAGKGVDLIQTFRVFDRWGNMVFEALNVIPSVVGSAAWDGTFKGQKLNPGVFTYSAYIKFADGKEIPYIGEIQLLH